MYMYYKNCGKYYYLLCLILNTLVFSMGFLFWIISNQWYLFWQMSLWGILLSPSQSMDRLFCAVSSFCFLALFSVSFYSASTLKYTFT